VGYSPVLSFLIEYLDLPEAVGDPAVTWESFQLQHLNNTSLLAIELKARQVGWSWLAAAESVASACIYGRTPHIFVSINQEESAEKIRYAHTVVEALDRDVRPKLIRENMFELEFANGSRIISHPCRPVRGKAKAKIYLDEFAHYPNDRVVYQSVLPAISKGGFVRIGSSPFGARGTFWEIFTESLRKYPGYVRQSIPWWSVTAFCIDVAGALVEAPGMPTEDRVYKYGTARLIQIFDNLPLDDFQQEYECAWLDETVSWIDWDLIKRNQVLAADGKLTYFRAKSVDEAMAKINELADLVIGARVEETLVGGMDIGRRKDLTEIILLGQNEMLDTLPYRLHISLDRVEFDGQEAVARKVLDVLPMTSFLIDQNGIGMQIAENLSAYPAAQGVDFTNATKQLWAVETKLRFQRGQVPIPLDRDLMYQIHSIRRKPTAAGNMVFEIEEGEKHHADMFWALALAIWGGKSDGEGSSVMVGDLEDYRG
jgi:phage FluMu gp28-like protein